MWSLSDTRYLDEKASATLSFPLLQSRQADLHSAFMLLMEADTVNPEETSRMRQL